MSGVYVYQVDRTPPHECDTPSQWSEPKPVAGDIWLCECGRLYECHNDHNLIRPGIFWRKRRWPLWGKLRRDVEQFRRRE